MLPTTLFYVTIDNDFDNDTIGKVEEVCTIIDKELHTSCTATCAIINNKFYTMCTTSFDSFIEFHTIKEEEEVYNQSIEEEEEEEDRSTFESHTTMCITISVDDHTTRTTCITATIEAYTTRTCTKIGDTIIDNRVYTTIDVEYHTTCTTTDKLCTTTDFETHYNRRCSRNDDSNYDYDILTPTKTSPALLRRQT